MLTPGVRFLLALGTAAFLSAQQIPDARITQMPEVSSAHATGFDRFTKPYRAPVVSLVDFRNSNRIYSLIRGGQLYLTLQDAIALALENSLDVELQRFGLRIAESDLLRARGGGLLRGVPLTIRELPTGVGGPGSPLLTTVGGITPVTSIPATTSDLAPITGQTTDLSILGAAPLATGPRIPGFDPAIIGQLNAGHTSTPQTNQIVSGTNQLKNGSFFGNAGLVQGFSTGTSYNLGFNANRQTTNSTRSSYNPYTTGSLGLNVTQPLLQGFGTAVNRRFITIAGNNVRITDYVFRQQIIDTLSSVIRLYWDLVSLEEDVSVKRRSFALAQKLYEDNKTQVEVGTLAPIEVKRAMAEVARGRQDIINAESLLLQQELILKNVLTRRGTLDALVSDARIVPTDHIAIPAQEAVRPVADLVSEAFRNRPDLSQAHLQIENSRISLKGSRNALLPELDLVGNLQNNALAGQATTNPGVTPDPALIGGPGTFLSQIASRSFPNYSIGLQLNIPIRNRTAQADVIRDELQLRQSQVREQQLENQVRLEVENAQLIMARSRAAYDAAVETRQLQEEALEAEQERYGVGASTTYVVIQYQRDLAQARSTEVVTAGNYAKSKAALDRATGETLINNNVAVEEAYQGTVARPSAIPAH